MSVTTTGVDINGLLTITGDGERDVIVVQPATPAVAGSITVRANSEFDPDGAGPLTAAKVHNFEGVVDLVINTGGGNDAVTLRNNIVLSGGENASVTINTGGAATDAKDNDRVKIGTGLTNNDATPVVLGVTVTDAFGRNVITTAEGNDNITGGAGRDIINSGAGNDVLNGDAGNDILRGGDGNDQLKGGDGNDLLLGGDGDDDLDDGAGRDRLLGQAGDDFLVGDDDDVDRLLGGQGNDGYSDGDSDRIVDPQDRRFRERGFNDTELDAHELMLPEDGALSVTGKTDDNVDNSDFFKFTVADGKVGSVSVDTLNGFNVVVLISGGELLETLLLDTDETTPEESKVDGLAPGDYTIEVHAADDDSDQRVRYRLRIEEDAV